MVSLVFNVVQPIRTGTRLRAAAIVASVSFFFSSQRSVWHSPKLPIVAMALTPSRMILSTAVAHAAASTVSSASGEPPSLVVNAGIIATTPFKSFALSMPVSFRRLLGPRSLDQGKIEQLVPCNLLVRADRLELEVEHPVLELLRDGPVGDEGGRGLVVNPRRLIAGKLEEFRHDPYRPLAVRLEILEALERGPVQPLGDASAVLKKSRARRYSALKRPHFVDKIRQRIKAELLRLKARRRRERGAVDRPRLQGPEDDFRGPYIDDADVLPPVQAVSLQDDLEQPVVGAARGRAADLRPLHIRERPEAFFDVELERRLVVEHHRDFQRRAAQDRRQAGRADDLAPVHGAGEHRLDPRSGPDPGDLDAEAFLPVEAQLVGDQIGQRARRVAGQMHLHRRAAVGRLCGGREGKADEQRCPKDPMKAPRSHSYLFGSYSLITARKGEKSLTSPGEKSPLIFPALFASSMDARMALSLAVPSRLKTLIATS